MGTFFRQEFWGKKKKAPIRRSGPLLKVYHGLGWMVKQNAWETECRARRHSRQYFKVYQLISVPVPNAAIDRGLGAFSNGSGSFSPPELEEKLRQGERGPIWENIRTIHPDKKTFDSEERSVVL
jgi:hypothetical protein